MNLTRKQNLDKPAHSKETQDVSNMLGRRHEILARIREARKKCGDGVKMLPVVRYERKLWFLDERLRQLRNVRNPHDFVDLSDFEIEYFLKEAV